MSVLIETYAFSNGNEIAKIGFGTWLLKDGDECYNAVADALRLGWAAIGGNPSRFSSWSDKLTPWAVRMPSSKRTMR
jgi:cytochrome b